MTATNTGPGVLTTSLPAYIGHKIVAAAKIRAIDFGGRLDLMPFGVREVGEAWIEQRGAHVGGYFVEYADGYTSYSPAGVFEEGYTLTEGPRVIDAGHRYRIKGPQVLQFLKKESVGRAGAFVTTAEGTTTEEVLEVVLDRLRTMNATVPCRENSLAIINIEQGLMWLEQRTRNRTERGVEGSPLA